MDANTLTDEQLRRILITPDGKGKDVKTKALETLLIRAQTTVTEELINLPEQED